jgi:hypothetical protein
MAQMFGHHHPPNGLKWGLCGALGPSISQPGQKHIGPICEDLLVHKAKIIEFARTKYLHRDFFCSKNCHISMARPFSDEKEL